MFIGKKFRCYRKDDRLAGKLVFARKSEVKQSSSLKSLKAILLLPLLSLQLLLSSCAVLGIGKATEENFRQVKVGQTQAEIEEALGKPLSIENKSDVQILRYQILRENLRSSDPYLLILKENRLSEIVFDTQSAQGRLQLLEQRGKASQKCESIRPEVAGPQTSQDNNIGANGRAIPDSCESAPPLK